MSDATSEIDDGTLLEQTMFEVKKVIVGQDRLIERLMVCLLARGHCLLEGVPGLAKTLAAETLAKVVGGTFARLQFTPDLMPADIMGTRIYRASTERFDVELGPVFVNFLLTDEINRAPAKVQSALLEVMAEHQVSIGGQTFPVPEPFLVLATQNPIESEGVYSLPEAQRDRFMMKAVVGYPTVAEEAQIVNRMGVSPPEPSEVLSLDQLIRLQARTDEVYVDQGVVEYAVALVTSTRTPSTYPRPRRRGPRPRGDAQPHLRAAAGRVRHRPRRAPPPARAQLRSPRAGDRGRPRAGPRALDHPRAAHRPVAGSDRHPDQLKTSMKDKHTANVPPRIGLEEPAEILRRLDLAVSRRLDGLLQGDHRGLVPGQGSESGECRIYQDGDDVRRIDWNVTARNQMPFVRETIADRELETWLLVDLSPSLDFGTALCTKRDLAVAAAAAVGFLTARTGNRVGAVILAGGRITAMPARSGRTHLQAILHRLITTPTGDGGGATDLAGGIGHLAIPSHRRGLAVVISDFLAPEGWERPLRQVGIRHEALGIEIVDPRELELPPVGMLSLVDPETGRRREVQTANATFRKRYAEAAADQRETIARTLRSSAIDHLQLRTDRDWLLDLVRFVAYRRQRVDHIRRAR
jgi:MoxR-like ATPase/uncharacterized protein (DUF58 family)